jgi:hypothetical protein
MAPGLVGQTIERAGGSSRMRLYLADAEPPSMCCGIPGWVWLDD